MTMATREPSGPLRFRSQGLAWLIHPYFRHSATVLSLSLAGGVLNMLGRIVLGRLLTGEQYGEMETALQAGSHLMMPLSTLQLLLIREVADADGAGERSRLQSAVRRLGGWILAYGALSALLLLILAPLLRDWFHYGSGWPFAATASLSVTGAALMVGSALLQGTRQFWRNGVMGLTGPVIRIAATWALVALGYGATGAIAALSLANAGMGVASLFLALPLLIPWRPSEGAASSALARAWLPLTLFFWLGALLGGVDLFFIKRVFDPWTAGDYARTSAIVRQVLAMNGVFTVTLFPWVAAERGGGRGTGHLLIRALGAAALMAAGAALLLSLFPSLILRLFYGMVTPAMLRWTPRLAWALAPGSLIPLLIQYVLARRDHTLLGPLGLVTGLYLLSLHLFRHSVESLITAVGAGLGAIVGLMILGIAWSQRGRGGASRQAATSTPSLSRE